MTKRFSCEKCGHLRTVKFCDTCYTRLYYPKWREKHYLPSMQKELEWANCEIERLTKIINNFNDAAVELNKNLKELWE